mgnify:CR=1 FL=1
MFLKLNDVAQYICFFIVCFQTKGNILPSVKITIIVVFFIMFILRKYYLLLLKYGRFKLYLFIKIYAVPFGKIVRSSKFVNLIIIDHQYLNTLFLNLKIHSNLIHSLMISDYSKCYLIFNIVQSCDLGMKSYPHNDFFIMVFYSIRTQFINLII